MSAAAGDRKGTRALSELVAGAVAPLSARRSYILPDLAAAWPEVVGPRYADCTEPERIDWPRQAENGGCGQLRVRAAGPKAVLLQHELGQLTERVNAYLGHRAIDRIRLVQGPVRRKPPPRPPVAPPVDEKRLAEAVAGTADDPLTAALTRLGRGVLGSHR